MALYQLKYRMNHWWLFHLAMQHAHCFATNTSTYVRPIKYRYWTNHIWIRIHSLPYVFDIISMWQLCSFAMCIPHSNHVYWLSVMKTCKLFVVQIQNWFDYARYIFRSFHFVVQNGMGMQAIVSWLHMEFNENANEIDMALLPFVSCFDVGWNKSSNGHPCSPFHSFAQTMPIQVLF